MPAAVDVMVWVAVVTGVAGLVTAIIRIRPEQASAKAQHLTAEASSRTATLTGYDKLTARMDIRMEAMQSEINVLKGELRELRVALEAERGHSRDQDGAIRRLEWINADWVRFGEDLHARWDEHRRLPDAPKLPTTNQPPRRDEKE